MFLDKIIDSKKTLIDGQINLCLSKENSAVIDQLQVSKVALEGIRLNTFFLIILKVINAVVKIFDKNYLSIDKLIYSNNVCNRLIENYTQLIKDPNAFIDDLGFTYDVGIERLKKKFDKGLEAPLQVTMVGVEYAGLIKSGGLAEALEGLTKGLKELNPANRVQLIFPKYSHLPKELLDQMKVAEEHTSSQGEKYLVYKLAIDGIECQFISDPSFELDWENPSVYGPDFSNQMARFAAFSGLAADLIYEQKNTDLVHLHDWHVAGVGLKLKKNHPEEWNRGEIPAVVFTYHNNQRQMQGRLPSGTYTYDPVIKGYQENEIINRNENLFVRTLFDADAVTTVSEKFATESQQIELGEGISFAARVAARTGKLTGILNGANLQRWSPETNASLRNWKCIDTGQAIDLSYGADTPNLLEKKGQIKEQLAKWIQKYSPDVKIDLSKPIVTFIGRFDFRQKGIDRLEEAIEATLKKGGQFICMGTDPDEESEKILLSLKEKYPRGVFFIRDYRDAAGRLYYQDGDGTRPGISALVRAATNFVLVPSNFEPCGLVQFEGWQFGSLAIGSNTGGLADSIKKGSGFLFTERVADGINEALDSWNGLTQEGRRAAMRHVMNGVEEHTWKKAAEKYRIVYANALQRKELRQLSVLETIKLDSVRNRSMAPFAKENVQRLKEERYLTEFYLGQNHDSVSLEKLYKTIPENLRSTLPSPYGAGVDSRMYEKFGVIGGNRFVLSAPHARQIDLVLTSDDEKSQKIVPMMRDSKGNWTATIPDLKIGQKYQYKIDGTLKQDPFARTQAPWKDPNKASYSIVSESKHVWGDGAWMRSRAKQAGQSQPMSIYEVHPLSWKKKDGKPLNYREMADELVNYCAASGHTHVELFGILEHPFEKSLGYQITGYFAPTSRLGSVDDFKYLVEHLHKNKIGVFIDWVPAHFAQEDFGLKEFDGTNQYEATGLKYFFTVRNWFLKYGSKHFDFMKKSVREFLISSAMYWIREMHVDGLRVDCVFSMLATEDSQSADLFMRDLNAAIHNESKGAITMAEDFSGNRRVTASSMGQGLDFDMKWHVSFFNKVLSYFATPAKKRSSHYPLIEEAIQSDNFHKQILFIGHDQQRHYKKMLEKIKDPAAKAATIRSIHSLMMCLPGKKLQFMGTDGVQVGQWQNHYAANPNKGWFNDHTSDPQLITMMATLHDLYKNHSALHELDANGRDLEWIADPNQKIHAYRRTSSEGESLICLHNFTDEESLFSTPSLYNKKLEMLFNSDGERFGGKGKSCKVAKGSIKIPPLTTIILRQHD